MDPRDVQARIRLAALLFKTAMPRLAQSLAAAGKGAPRAQDKERLYAHLEQAAWNLGPEAVARSDDEGWEEDVLALASVRALLAAAVDDATRSR